MFGLTLISTARYRELCAAEKRGSLIDKLGRSIPEMEKTIAAYVNLTTQQAVEIARQDRMLEKFARTRGKDGRYTGKAQSHEAPNI